MKICLRVWSREKKPAYSFNYVSLNLSVWQLIHKIYNVMVNWLKWFCCRNVNVELPTQLQLHLEAHHQTTHKSHHHVFLFYFVFVFQVFYLKCWSIKEPGKTISISSYSSHLLKTPLSVDWGFDSFTVSMQNPIMVQSSNLRRSYWPLHHHGEQ